jgi:hypothetical protein
MVGASGVWWERSGGWGRGHGGGWADVEWVILGIIAPCLAGVTRSRPLAPEGCAALREGLRAARAPSTLGRPRGGGVLADHDGA